MSFFHCLLPPEDSKTFVQWSVRGYKQVIFHSMQLCRIPKFREIKFFTFPCNEEVLFHRWSPDAGHYFLRKLVLVKTNVTQSSVLQVCSRVDVDFCFLRFSQSFRLSLDINVNFTLFLHVFLVQEPSFLSPKLLSPKFLSQ